MFNILMDIYSADFPFTLSGEEELDLIHKDKPFHHLFVWAVLVNRREMAMIFWEQETDLTCKMFYSLINEIQ